MGMERSDGSGWWTVRGRRRKLLLGLAAAAAVGTLVVLGSNAYVLLSADGRSSERVEGLPHAQAALVLGALVQPDGRMSMMLADRVERAVELWRAGKVEKVIVSGDHGQWSYDEPGAMKAALLRAGVPARAVFTDHAGFNTWASVVRARTVFGVESAIVVTQGFHMPRALFLAERAGLEAHGLTSDLHEYGGQGLRSDLREVASRVKAVFDGTFGTPVMAGPRIPIQGDGRASWGPPPPEGAGPR